MTDWKKNPLFRIAGNWINSQIKEQDYLAAQRVDQFVANSKEVQGRIKKFYGRESVVIYPPVDIEVASSKPVATSYKPQATSASTTKQPSNQATNKPYYLFVSRLAFSKHPELSVEVCTKLGLPLKVVGQGKMLPRLKSIAGPTIEFAGEVTDEELAQLYQGAKALLYPVEDEDFGIVPVEAMGHGLPVIAHRSGGPKETIVDGETGIFFDTLSAAELQKAIEKADKIYWDAKAIHAHALKFSKQRFQDEMKQLVEKLVDEFDS